MLPHRPATGAMTILLFWQHPESLDKLECLLETPERIAHFSPTLSLPDVLYAGGSEHSVRTPALLTRGFRKLT